MPAVNPCIQGLRGVAIALVLLNHAGVPGFGGGYVGVDLFFVISGYLIGGLLIREMQRTGRIDLGSFYARRFRRLLPAAVALLLFVMLAGRLLYAPMEHAELFSSVRAAALYAGNLWFASRATDYFGGHVEANPILHLWSLAVEEQFYLLWPLLMLGVAAFAKGRVVVHVQVLAVFIGIVTLLACVAVTDRNKAYAFFLTPFRVWEFAAGVLLGTAAGRERAAARWSAEALGVAGLLLLLFSTLMLGPATAFPGMAALMPVLAGVLLLRQAEPPGSSLTGRWLAWRPLRVLGDWSYSVYLWHWPLLLFLGMLWPQQRLMVGCAGVVLSVLIGWQSYRWLETPFRTRLWPMASARRVVIVSLSICAALALMAWLLGRAPLTGDQLRYRNAQSWHEVNQTGCLVGFDAIDAPDCSFGPADAPRTVVLLGDSHALQWLTAFREMAAVEGWRLVVFGKSACPAVNAPVMLQAKGRPYVECGRWREGALQRILLLKPHLVVLASSTSYPISDVAWAAGLESTLHSLRGSGAVVAALRDTPRPGFNVPVCLARASWQGRAGDAACSYARSGQQIWSEERAATEARILASAGAAMIDLSEFICDGVECATERDGVVLFSDADHLSMDHARRLQGPLRARLNALLPS